MATNTFRKKENPKRFRWLGSFSKPITEKSAAETTLPTKYIPYLLFLAMLGLLYITNSHYAEKMVRETSKLEAEVENLRSDYTTLRAEFDTFIGKQSEIAEKAKALGLEEGKGKVQKIIIPKGAY
jgi:cell division protein FtsL